MEYVVILAVVIVVTPYVLRLAVRQDKKTREGLGRFFLGLLVLELVLGALSWDGFGGMSGYKLALEYPESYLWVFFAVVAVQVGLVMMRRRWADVGAVGLNFVATVVFFVVMIRLSDAVGRQVVSVCNVAAVFAALIGNVVGLAWINRDKQLVEKFPWSGRVG